MPSRNFTFLGQHDPLFEQLAEAAERNLVVDPNTTLIKLRQLAEAFARQAAASAGIPTGPQTTQLELLRALESRGLVEREVAGLFHALRRAGNDANHDFVGSRTQALDHLKLGRQLAIWFHRTFGGVDARRNFNPGAFAPPEDHTARLRVLEEELAKARLDAEAHRRNAEKAATVAELEARRRSEAEALAAQAAQEREIYAQLAEEVEGKLSASKQAFDAGLVTLQQAGAAKTEQEQTVLRGLAANATAQVELDEAGTRLIIDAQLRAAGWEADSVKLRYAHGARPEKGVNRAIAEWPTASGPADYVLFRGLTPVAVVEAKRKAKNVADAIEQAKRYSLGFSLPDEFDRPRPIGAPDTFPGWKSGLADESGAMRNYRVPFLFATNGRAFLRQYELESGVWFLDARRRTNHARALVDWYTPDGLAELLAQDDDAAEHALAAEPTDYLHLRDYQVKAIRAVERAIEDGKRTALLAMATGTGKTRTVIGLAYRLLKSKRFRRLLFLVDRSSLGEQAQDAFKEVRLEGSLFSEIFEVRELGDQKPDASTKVHVATVQGMVKRVLYPSDGAEPLPVDAYDCIVVDESHRGYTLDRGLGEGEAQVRDFRDYVSTYRRVLDHFDAVKVGLTATPALHTREIFGDAVFTYAYPEAVADGWLVDHEPPIRLKTRLSEEGIVFDKGEQVPVRTGPGQIDLWEMPDELSFEVDAFNRLVITEGFNKVVCEYLASQLDPQGDEKTLVFCANDAHADLVVKLLKEAFDAKYGPVDDATVLKITGSVDEPLKRIRRFKNEPNPRVAVTVDLLTTGIDVPEITNLVFIRRVRSRILYDQMLGRATRRCDRIGKSVFRIYDAVDLYEVLADVTSMKPLVKDVSIPPSQLLAELVSPASHAAPGAEAGQSHADVVLTALVERLRRRVRKGSNARTKPTPEFAEALQALEDALGHGFDDLPSALRELGARGVAKLLESKPTVGVLLERVLTIPVTPSTGQFISTEADELRSAELGFPDGKRPADYLESFRKFIAEHQNKVAALAVVVQRPRELTRQQLKELRLELEAHAFRERDLKAAWRALKNEDIAAGIVGFVRQQALGSPLVAYETRVERALQKILAKQAWTPPQRKWLERIAKQLKQETVVDRAALDEEPFKEQGGAKYFDKMFDGKVGEVLEQLQDAVWSDAA